MENIIQLGFKYLVWCCGGRGSGSSGVADVVVGFVVNSRVDWKELLFGNDSDLVNW
jgi:hypothetical protein